MIQWWANDAAPTMSPPANLDLLPLSFCPPFSSLVIMVMNLMPSTPRSSILHCNYSQYFYRLHLSLSVRRTLPTRTISISVVTSRRPWWVSLTQYFCRISLAHSLLNLQKPKKDWKLPVSLPVLVVLLFIVFGGGMLALMTVWFAKPIGSLIISFIAYSFPCRFANLLLKCYKIEP